MTPPSGSGLNLRAPFPFGFEAAQRERDEDACPRCGELGTMSGGNRDDCRSIACSERRLGGND